MYQYKIKCIDPIECRFKCPSKDVKFILDTADLVYDYHELISVEDDGTESLVTFNAVRHIEVFAAKRELNAVMGNNTDVRWMTYKNTILINNNDALLVKMREQLTLTELKPYSIDDMKKGTYYE